jgi:phytoene desaturase
MKASEAIYRVGFEQLGHVPFDRWTDMAKIVPDMIRLGSHRTVYGMVAKHIRDERVRQVLSFHPLLIGGNPFDSSSIYTLISFLERQWGVWSAMGGTGAIVDAMARLVERVGGEIEYRADVEEIHVENGRAAGVRLSGGRRLDADVVVSNADAAWTYRRLVDAGHRRRWTDRRIERARFSSGLFVWYFGTKRTFPEVPHHTIMLGPRYKGLLEDIFKRKVLAEDFSIYLHRPTATDPALAPPGHDTFYALAPVPHLGGEIDWSEEAEPLQAAIERHLDHTVLPGLPEAVETSFTATPVDFERRLLAFRGSGFSFEPTLTQSAWFRPHNRSEDVEGLYLVGAGTHPGAGLPGVISSARILDKVVPPPS